MADSHQCSVLLKQRRKHTDGGHPHEQPHEHRPDPKRCVHGGDDNPGGWRGRRACSGCCSGSGAARNSDHAVTRRTTAKDEDNAALANAHLFNDISVWGHHGRRFYRLLSYQRGDTHRGERTNNHSHASDHRSSHSHGVLPNRFRRINSSFGRRRVYRLLRPPSGWVCRSTSEGGRLTQMEPTCRRYVQSWRFGARLIPDIRQQENGCSGTLHLDARFR